MFEFIGLLIAIALLVGVRLAYEGVRRMFSRPDIAKELHNRCGVELSYRGTHVKCDSCVLMESERVRGEGGHIYTRYVFEAFAVQSDV